MRKKLLLSLNLRKVRWKNRLNGFLFDLYTNVQDYKHGTAQLFNRLSGFLSQFSLHDQYRNTWHCTDTYIYSTRKHNRRTFSLRKAGSVLPSLDDNIYFPHIPGSKFVQHDEKACMKTYGSTLPRGSWSSTGQSMCGGITFFHF